MKKILPITLMLFVIFACRKKHKDSPSDDNATNDPLPAPTASFSVKDYLPLKKGNYWIFDVEYKDSAGAVIMSLTDSTFVADSSQLRNRTFFHIQSMGVYNALNGHLPTRSIILSKPTALLISKFLQKMTL